MTTVQDGLPFSVVNAAASGAASLLWGASIPPTGPYSRVQHADPVNCNSLGVCKSGIPLETPGSLTQRVVSGLNGGNGLFNPAAFAQPELFGGVPSAAPGPYTGNCTGPIRNSLDAERDSVIPALES